MKVLLDTHVLLWAAGQPERLSQEAREMLANEEYDLIFSAVSLWEITIKNRLGRKDFSVDPRLFRRGLLDNGYSELVITSLHAVSVDLLPDLHRDPFDRLLIAQALSEGIIFLTNDTILAKYPGAIRII